MCVTTCEVELACGSPDLTVLSYFRGVVCHVQSVVPDLSYTVRSPMLDTWEGIKQLKAALWALVSSVTSCVLTLHTG